MKSLPEPNVERALVALASHVEFPEPADVRPAVLRRLRPLDVASASWSPRRWQPAVAAAFVFVLVSTLLLTALPQARRAVADLLGFDGLEIEVVDQPIPADIGRDLQLGTAVSRREALASFDVVPSLGSSIEAGPGRIFLSEPDFMLSIVYGPAPDLPPAARAGVSLLVSALDGDLHDGFAEKVIMSGEASVRPVVVRGAQGYWIHGSHAFFVYSREDGRDELESSRIANSVLVWEEAGLILRIEGALSRGEALEIADGMRLEGR